MIRLDPDTDPPFPRDQRRRSLSAFAMLLATAPVISAAEQNSWLFQEPRPSGNMVATASQPSRSQSISISPPINLHAYISEHANAVLEDTVQNPLTLTVLIWESALSVDGLRVLLASEPYNGDTLRFSRDAITSLEGGIALGQDTAAELGMKIKNIIEALLKDETGTVPHDLKTNILFDILCMPGYEAIPEDFEGIKESLEDVVESVKLNATVAGSQQALQVLKKLYEDLSWFQGSGVDERVLAKSAEMIASASRRDIELRRSIYHLIESHSTFIDHQPSTNPSFLVVTQPVDLVSLITSYNEAHGITSNQPSATIIDDSDYAMPLTTPNLYGDFEAWNGTVVSSFLGDNSPRSVRREEEPVNFIEEIWEQALDVSALEEMIHSEYFHGDRIAFAKQVSAAILFYLELDSSGNYPLKIHNLVQALLQGDSISSNVKAEIFYELMAIDEYTALPEDYDDFKDSLEQSLEAVKMRAVEGGTRKDLGVLKNIYEKLVYFKHDVDERMLQRASELQRASGPDDRDRQALSAYLGRKFDCDLSAEAPVPASNFVVYSSPVQEPALQTGPVIAGEPRDSGSSASASLSPSRSSNEDASPSESIRSPSPIEPSAPPQTSTTSRQTDSLDILWSAAGDRNELDIKFHSPDYAGDRNKFAKDAIATITRTLESSQELTDEKIENIVRVIFEDPQGTLSLETKANLLYDLLSVPKYVAKEEHFQGGLALVGQFLEAVKARAIEGGSDQDVAVTRNIYGPLGLLFQLDLYAETRLCELAREKVASDPTTNRRLILTHLSNPLLDWESSPPVPMTTLVNRPEPEPEAPSSTGEAPQAEVLPDVPEEDLAVHSDDAHGDSTEDLRGPFFREDERIAESEAALVEELIHVELAEFPQIVLVEELQETIEYTEEPLINEVEFVGGDAEHIEMDASSGAAMQENHSADHGSALLFSSSALPESEADDSVADIEESAADSVESQSETAEVQHWTALQVSEPTTFEHSPAIDENSAELVLGPLIEEPHQVPETIQHPVEPVAQESLQEPIPDPDPAEAHQPSEEADEESQQSQPSQAEQEDNADVQHATEDAPVGSDQVHSEQVSEEEQPLSTDNDQQTTPPADPQTNEPEAPNLPVPPQPENRQPHRHRLASQSSSKRRRATTFLHEKPADPQKDYLKEKEREKELLHRAKERRRRNWTVHLSRVTAVGAVCFFSLLGAGMYYLGTLDPTLL